MPNELTESDLLALARRMNEIKARMVHHEQARYGEDFDVEMLRRLLVDSGWVTASTHHAAVKAETDHQWRLLDEMRAVEAELSKVQSQVDVGRIERVQRMARLLKDAPRKRGRAHDADCWRRHTGCMAELMRKALVADPDAAVEPAQPDLFDLAGSGTRPSPPDVPKEVTQ